VKNGSTKAAGTAREDREFELIGGHPALDLVNTLDWRFRESGTEELMLGYEDVLHFVRQSGLITVAEARRLSREVSESKGAKVTAAFLELREAAAELFYALLEEKAPSAAAIRMLEGIFARSRQDQRLMWRDSKVVWELVRRSDAELPLHLLAMSTTELMSSDAMEMLRACSDPACRWLFLDTSKNHSRRWCDMKICGNRMKARRFKAQHRD
jgi:predicted RNA-binding Zn ribbon-like protein